MLMKGASQQVLQRTFSNHSTIFFSYANRDANRARGINAHELYLDEFQLMIGSNIPILQRTMDGSLFGSYESYAGTSLSPTNILEQEYLKSTMSLWMIKCRHCGKDNVAETNYDLLKMVGPVTNDISPEKPGLVCAHCSKSSERGRKPLYTQDGRWWHRAPERRNDYLGVHIPQPIMSWHANDRDRWITLHNIIKTANQAELWNEVFGEPYDSLFKPITAGDLQRAACLGHPNKLRDALSRRSQYSFLAMGIDWGGGGISGVSRTKASIVGISNTGKLDVIYGIDLQYTHDPVREVKALMMLANQFGVSLIAHDAGGGVGADKEAMMYAAAAGNAELMPINYSGYLANRYIDLRSGVNPQDGAQYVVDKARTLMFLCQAVKQGFVRFFNYDYQSPENPGLLHDFLALNSQVAKRVIGSDVLLIQSDPEVSDDFVHATNFACVACWYKFQIWPKLTLNMNFSTLQELDANASQNIEGGIEALESLLSTAL